jgi:hypothetical protein
MSYVTPPGNGTIVQAGHHLRIYIWHQSLLQETTHKRRKKMDLKK